ncbi:MAG: DNA-binding protein [Clostridia bacterium]|nr:DNA-binding protein [Clostridia bacterium]
MNSYVGNGLGRVVVINLKRDDPVLESIESELARLGIRDAIVTSAIGSLQRAVFHRVTGMEREPVDEFVTLDKPIELASLQGLVLDGKAHFHMTLSDTGEAYTGHLEPGTLALYLVEISLVEIAGLALQRVKNEDNIATLLPR